MAIDHHRLHHTDRATARQRIDEVTRELGKSLGIKQRWEADVLTFSGKGVKGSLSADDKHVHVHIKKGRLVPVSEGWIRKELFALLDTHFPPTASAPAPTSAAPEARSTRAETPPPTATRPPHPEKPAPENAARPSQPDRNSPGALLGQFANLAGQLTEEALRLGEDTARILLRPDDDDSPKGT